ncbi:MAG: DUF2442 domain-containing protein [Candidatus Scalindua sp.]
MYLSVIDVKPLDGYKLLLTFKNKEKRLFDVSPYLNIGKFSELKELSLFNTVKIKFDSIEWNNSLDLDPELLYQKSIKLNEELNTSSSA